MRWARAIVGTLLRYAARQTRLPADFVEAEYLRANPDVAHAVAAGLVRSGVDHWLSSGVREGRPLSAKEGPVLPPGFDESVYLAANPDVRLAVQRGVFPTGASHWLSAGYKDGRAYRQDAPGQAGLEQTWDRLVAARNAGSPLGWRARSAVLDLGGFDAAAYARRNQDIGDLSGMAPEHILRHWLEQGFRQGRTPFGYRPYLDRKLGPNYQNRENSVSFFGFLQSNTGLGQSARNYLKALETLPIPVDAYDIVDGGGRFDVPSWPPAGERRRSKVNIFHINADMTHRFFLDDRAAMLDGSYNVGVWFWELLHFPEEWMSAFGAFDEIWVASDFVRRSIASVAPIPVVKIPMVVAETMTSVPLPRSHFNIPDDVFVYACIFDVGSVIARKNPAAAIQAFRQAFADRDDVLLIMKCHGSHHYPESFDALRRLAGSSRNIRFLDRDLSEHEMSSFKAAIDCLISPHRSEGFGLNIAEAMLARIPVIATGFSGNMEFMTAANSHLLAYDLREVGQSHGPYAARALWAEPKIDDLAKLMSSVVEHREIAAAKAGTARDDIFARHGIDTVARAIGHRLETLRLFSPTPSFVETWGRGLDARTDFYPTLGPRISIVIAVADIEGRLLHRCVSSVLRQAYARWELILHDDGSAASDAAWYIDALRGSDFRIKLSVGAREQATTRASDGPLAFSSGEYVVRLCGSDALAPEALSDVVTAILGNPRLELVSSDEGSSADATGRPPLLAIRRSLVLRVGEFHDYFTVAGDRGFVERVNRAAHEVVHLSKVPYRRRDDRTESGENIDR